MTRKINWRRVWAKYELLEDEAYSPDWQWQKRTIQRLVNAELRGAKKGARK